MIHLFPNCFLFVLLVCCSHFWLLLRVNASLQLLGYPCFPKGWDTTSYAIQHSLFLAVSLTLSRHTLTSLTHSLSTHLSILVYLLTPSLSHRCVYIYISSRRQGGGTPRHELELEQIGRTETTTTTRKRKG